MSERLRWGILGTGAIARVFARDLAQARRGELVAVGSRSEWSADGFVASLGKAGVRAHDSYESLLADPTVDAVYISTPHPEHAGWAIRAAAAGKHVLVEKPLGMNGFQAEAIVDAAERNGVFLMEAFMYRCHPQTRVVCDLVRDGAIGEVRVIEASFGFHWPRPYDPTSRLLDPALGGGAILDVGCYPVSFARMVAGVVAGLPFADPVELQATGVLGQTGVDEWAAATLRFEGGIVAQVSTAIQCELANDAIIYGSEGSIYVKNPWSPDRDGGAQVEVRRGGVTEVIAVAGDRPLYAIEADAVAEAIAAGRREAGAMSWDDSLGNARALDRWRAAVGLRYPFERDEGFPASLLVTSGGNTSTKQIPKITIAGLEKPVSQLALGVQGDANEVAVMLDAFWEAGGYTFDTAWWYGRGAADRMLGRWLASRGCREDVVVIAKGAHTPDCTPAAVTAQLEQSLEFLGTDYADIYCLHRDNLEVPVAEFAEVLNEHVRRGQIRVFGASNWSLERVVEFNTYAEAHGLQGFGVVSNNFSLARMVRPVWPGCIASSTPEYRAWHERTGTPLLAWSSQARGFFVHGDVEKRTDAELVDSWYSDDNFERLRRARVVAERYGVTANNVALAYVLQQSFPTVALIGPRSLRELRTTLPALGVTLTPEEMRWLNLEMANDEP